MPVKLLQYKLTHILLTYQYNIYIDYNYYLLHIHVYAIAVSEPNKYNNRTPRMFEIHLVLRQIPCLSYIYINFYQRNLELRQKAIC